MGEIAEGAIQLKTHLEILSQDLFSSNYYNVYFYIYCLSFSSSAAQKAPCLRGDQLPAQPAGCGTTEGPSAAAGTLPHSG